jgi:DNA polymerase
MDELHLDFETRSEIDLSERGLDNYARHPSTKTLMLAYAINDGKVHLWEPHRSAKMPAELSEALADPWVTKAAWNSTFERSILRSVHNIWIPYQEWTDPMVHAKHLSMPGALADVGKVLGLGEGEAKDSEGKRLIGLFCTPAIQGEDGGLFGATPAGFRDWSTDPEEWGRFCDYCKRDVVAERAITKKLKALTPFPASEQRLWVLDQQINDAGLPVDTSMVKGARRIIDEEMAYLRGKLRGLTKLENPNSTDQMLAWVREQGYPFGALGKPFVARAFAGEGSLTPLGREALELRALTSKSAVHKFTAIADNVSEDGRLRGQFVFCGAARSGRWSGRDCQPQNFSRPSKEVEKRMDEAITLLRAGDRTAVSKAFTSALDVVVSCSRPSFRAPDGYQFIVCDLSAIEARVLSWLAGCENMQRVFRDGLDPYKDFATDLYNKPYDQVTKDERQNSKPAVLGCGYQLSGGEEIVTSNNDVILSGLWGYAHALSVPISREEAHRSVDVFRKKFPEIVDLWRATEDGALQALKTGEEQTVGLLTYRPIKKKLLQLVLPSGRPLNYLAPQTDKTEMTGKGGKTYQRLSVSYEGVDQKTRQWGRTSTYGGRWVENSCQAVARDILAHGMMLADEMGFEIVGHVHDEIIAMVPKSSHLGLGDLERCMSTAPSWAEGMLLGAEGFVSDYYKKG